MSILKEIGPEVEIAMADLAEALGLQQDDIPNADFILTKLAMACYNKGLKQGPKRPTTNPVFPAPKKRGREDETPRVVVLPKKDSRL